ncbi:MAG TPA: hypothetical protein VE777_17100 [Gaiellales bacterium]|jgi:hypothetical protein|nr:hypothetical protein [Gaiellales bacterium]
MSADDQLGSARRSAMLAVLRDIEQRAAQSGPMAPQAVLSLAEAYAWLERPDQPHGGRTLARPGGAAAAGAPQG